MNATDTDFQEVVLNDEGVVMVDFWADWCAPCKMLEPIVEEIETEFKSQSKPIKIVKVDVDSSPQTAQKYGIMSIPTLMIFKNGEPVKQLVGVQPKPAITDALDQAAQA